MDAAEVIERVTGHCGELALRRAGEHYEVIANGTFLMDTRNGESERLLVDAAARRMPPGGRMLIGGLGVGFSLRAAVDNQHVGEVVVVEREPAVIEWNHGPLREVHGGALDEPAVRVVRADLPRWLAECPESFDALCLDIDNGPEWTVDEQNAVLYGESGLDLLSSRLRPGGVLAVWSAGTADEFTARLRRRFSEVEVLEVPVPRGQPDLVLLGVSPATGVMPRH